MEFRIQVPGPSQFDGFEDDDYDPTDCDAREAAELEREFAEQLEELYSDWPEFDDD